MIPWIPSYRGTLKGLSANWSPSFRSALLIARWLVVLLGGAENDTLPPTRFYTRSDSRPFRSRGTLESNIYRPVSDEERRETVFERTKDRLESALAQYEERGETRRMLPLSCGLQYRTSILEVPSWVTARIISHCSFFVLWALRESRHLGYDSYHVVSAVDLHNYKAIGYKLQAREARRKLILKTTLKATISRDECRRWSWCDVPEQLSMNSVAR